jgi:hypothetical protein
MFSRQNKNSPWIGTLSYNFTRPVSAKGVAKTLKVALLFTQTEVIHKRSDILERIGVSKKDSKKHGYNACLFTALNWNRVIEYDKSIKGYKRGERYREFMEYTLNIFGNDPKLKMEHNKTYQEVAKASSNALHFMIA